jgi:25S rRNA (adenine2142-N1)-methyltransferase
LTTKGEEAMPADTERPPLRLLDVGAISGTAYADCPDIVATSIDLHPQSETVTQADFFRLPTPLPAEAYDVVALSLVLNFVGSVEERGALALTGSASRKVHGNARAQGRCSG